MPKMPKKPKSVKKNNKKKPSLGKKGGSTITAIRKRRARERAIMKDL